MTEMLDTIVVKLESKVNLLRKYKFVSLAYRAHLLEEKIDQVEEFTAYRESLLKEIDQADATIEELSKKINGQEVPTLYKEAVQLLLWEKESLVKGILDLDMELISLVEAIKSRVIQELSKVKSGRQSLRSYKTRQQSKNLASKV